MQTIKKLSDSWTVGCRNSESRLANCCHPQLAVLTANVWSAASFVAKVTILLVRSSGMVDRISKRNHHRPLRVHFDPMP